MTYTPEQLQNAFEAGLVPPGRELSALVRLARRLVILRPAAPAEDASRRMAARFEEVMAGRRRRSFAIWLPFLAAGETSRSRLAHRFAAGALAASLLGGATSTATGVSPAEAVRGAVRLADSAVSNLAPHLELGRRGPVAPPLDTQSEAALEGDHPAGEPAPDPGAAADNAEAPPGDSRPGSADDAPRDAAPSAAATPTPGASKTPPPGTPTPQAPANPPGPGSGQAAVPSGPAVSNPGPPPSGPGAGPSPSPSPAPPATPSPTPSPDDRVADAEPGEHDDDGTEEEHPEAEHQEPEGEDHEPEHEEEKGDEGEPSEPPEMEERR